MARLAVVTIATMSLLVCGCAFAAEPVRIGPEMGFETGTFDFECDIDDDKINATCLIQDRTSVHEGSRGIGITLLGPAPNDSDAVVLRSGEFDLDADELYTFTFWGFNPKPPAHVEAVIEDAESGKAVASANFSLLADWVEKAVNFTPKEDGQYRLALQGMGVNMSLPFGTSNKYMFDSFKVYKGNYTPEDYEAPKMIKKPDGKSSLALPPPVKIDEDGELLTPVTIAMDEVKSTEGALVLGDGEGKYDSKGDDDKDNEGDEDNEDDKDKEEDEDKDKEDEEDSMDEEDSKDSKEADDEDN